MNLRVLSQTASVVRKVLALIVGVGGFALGVFIKKRKA